MCSISTPSRDCSDTSGWCRQYRQCRRTGSDHPHPFWKSESTVPQVFLSWRPDLTVSSNENAEIGRLSCLSGKETGFGDGEGEACRAPVVMLNPLRSIEVECLVVRDDVEQGPSCGSADLGNQQQQNGRGNAATGSVVCPHQSCLQTRARFDQGRRSIADFGEAREAIKIAVPQDSETEWQIIQGDALLEPPHNPMSSDS